MKKFISFVIIVSVCTLPDLTYASAEYATFESFYKGTSTVAWIVAVVVAVAAAAAIIITGYLFNLLQSIL